MKTAKKRAIPVDIIDKIESTNSYIKEKCEQLPPWYTLRAKVQTAGRGRFSRQWISQPDEDLTFSILVPVNEKLRELMVNIPQITAVSLWELLDGVGVTTNIKWPNDILVDEKKMAGILVEGVSQSGKQYLVVGVGLNVNSSDFDQVGVPATSLYCITGEKRDPHELLLTFVDIFYDKIKKLVDFGFESFREFLDTHLAFKGEKRVVIVNGTEMYGIVEGIEETGTLRFRTEDGKCHSLISGEISFRLQV